MIMALGGIGLAVAEPRSVPQIAPLSSVALRPLREAPAQVVARHEAKIAAEISARIVALPFEVGQRVKRGALLVQLDEGDARLAVQRAEAQLAAAQARLAQSEAQTRRARELAARAFISADALQARESELAIAAADRQVAEAALTTARRALDKHRLYAPFDGVVRARPGQLGELATPGAALYLLAASAGSEVAARIPVTEADSLNQTTEFVFESALQRWPVRLVRLSPLIERPARSVEARFSFTAAAAAIGSEGRLLWRDERPHLPPEILVRRAEGLGVFVAQDGIARFVSLSQAQEGRPAPVALPSETLLVVRGQERLRDGAPLTPAGR